MGTYDGILLTFILVGVIMIIVSIVLYKWENTQEEKKSIERENQEELGITYEETSRKIIELHEYGEFLKEELDKRYKELLFLYQMIQEKQDQIHKDKKPVEKEGPQDIERPIEVKENPEIERLDDTNGKILKLYQKGQSSQEIAKALGIGVGQVDLVIHLFK